MNKLTKKYKVVHEGTKMVFPLTEEGDNAEVFPAVDTTAVEFDTYSEARAYVDEHGLVYEVSALCLVRCSWASDNGLPLHPISERA